MFISQIFQALIRRKASQKKVNPFHSGVYNNAIKDLEPSSDLPLNFTTDSTGTKIYYQEGLRELFPGNSRPSDKSLYEIKELLHMKDDLTLPVIWLCLNIHSDEIMKILRNDQKVHRVDNS